MLISHQVEPARRLLRYRSAPNGADGTYWSNPAEGTRSPFGAPQRLNRPCSSRTRSNLRAACFATAQRHATPTASLCSNPAGAARLALTRRKRQILRDAIAATILIMHLACDSDIYDQIIVI